jgi:hypothetical protein
MLRADSVPATQRTGVGSARVTNRTSVVFPTPASPTMTMPQIPGLSTSAAWTAVHSFSRRTTGQLRAIVSVITSSGSPHVGKRNQRGNDQTSSPSRTRFCGCGSCTTMVGDGRGPGQPADTTIAVGVHTMVPASISGGHVAVAAQAFKRGDDENHRHIRKLGTNWSRHQGKPVGCGDGSPLCCYWVHQRGQRLIVAMPLVVPALEPRLQVVHADRK